MEIYWSKLKGKISKLYNNESIGNVSEIYFTDKKVFGFEISKTYFLFDSKQFVMCDDIEAINNSLMIVRNTRNRIDISSFKKGADLLQKEVYNEKGNLLGLTIDIVFDSLNFEIIRFEAMSSFYSLLKNEKIILSPEEIILKEDKILS